MRLSFAISLGLAALLIGCTTATPEPTAVPVQPPPTSAAVVEPSSAAADPPSVTETSSPTAVLPTEAPTATVAPNATSAPVPTNPPAPQQVFITLQDFEIVPAETTISVGTEVVFLIKGAPGSLHQPYNFDLPNVFESPPGLGDGASYTYTFNEPGTVTVGCGYHPNMIATIIVTP